VSSPSEMICIACPLGCRLSVTPMVGDEVSVSGNRCPKGEVYAREELLAPRRTVTAVVRTDSAAFPYAPVRTDAPLPRGLADGLLQSLYSRIVTLPVRMGATLIADVGGTGVKVIFTRSLPPAAVPAIGVSSAQPPTRSRKRSRQVIT
jgi:CxxC motif-containing protein